MTDPTTPTAKPGKNAFLFVVVAVILNMISFGIIMPVMPALLEDITGLAAEQSVSIGGWLAMTFEVGDERFTAEYFEAPGMPTPSRYSERPYGRFGAFFKTSLTEDEPLKMTYRVNLTAGDPPSAEAIRPRARGPGGVG